MNVLPTEGEGLALVGFRISPASEDAELFTIIVYDGKDSPIVIDGRIAFVTKPERVTRLYRLCHKSVRALGPPPTVIDLICDFPETLDLIRRKKRDNKAVILNCLNTTFDLLSAINVPLPGEHQSVLYRLADHLTFNREFASFMRDNDMTRESIINALLWCVGAVAVNTLIVA